MADLIELVQNAISASRIPLVFLDTTEPDEKRFGNQQAVYRSKTALFRFVRDREQDILYISPASRPQAFYLYGDVEVALGWKTLEDVLTCHTLEPLDGILRRFAPNIETLDYHFSEGHIQSTIDILETVQEQRWNNRHKKIDHE